MGTYTDQLAQRMTTRTERITPEIAAEYLKQNEKNLREFRAAHAVAILSAFMRGEYQMTHQGIVFDKDGNMVDGHHRVWAIAHMPPGWSCEMQVTRNAPNAIPIDCGLVRPYAARLGISKELAEVSRFAADVYSGRAYKPTAEFVMPFARVLDPPLDELLEYCGSKCKKWSSAPMKTAACVISLSGGDFDYAKLVYRALVTVDIPTMPRIAQGLWRSHATGRLKGASPLDTFIRAMKVFDPKYANHSKLQIGDASTAQEIARETFRLHIPNLPRASITRPKVRKGDAGELSIDPRRVQGRSYGLNPD